MFTVTLGMISASKSVIYIVDSSADDNWIVLYTFIFIFFLKIVEFSMHFIFTLPEIFFLNIIRGWSIEFMLDGMRIFVDCNLWLFSKLNNV